VAEFGDELEQIVWELNRSASGAREARKDGGEAAPQNLSSLDSVLALAVRRSASDVLLIAGAPITMRLGGALAPTGATLLTSDETRGLLLPLLDPAGRQEF